MRLFFGLVFVLGISSLFAAEKGVEPTAEVVARLVEIPGKMPANDLYNYVYILKYKVVQVISGKVEEKEVLVGQYNPRVPRNQVKDKMDALVDGTVQAFKAGELHRLKLIKPMEKVWKDAVEDEYFDDTSERYFAVQTDLEKK